MEKPPIHTLVGIRPQPTVVRLDHLAAADSTWITDTYYLTAEVRGHLQALRHALGEPTGRGVFLIGHYGSGKTHFLAYLIRELRHNTLAADPPAVAEISLLNFGADNRLEAIVATRLGLPDCGGDRRTIWAALAATYPSGLLLVLDELSEFLRSKPTAQAFTEDVRFLQFLGEWAQGHRLWVLAAMQESIEHTGELEYALYRKIKDRFPLRLLLTPTHVRDLIGERILVKQPGYDEAVAELCRRLADAFPGAVDLATLARIYPLHPATLELLEAVRDRFSQTRGIIDFTVTQLAGNPQRAITPFLDRPVGSLLTPDFIVDHFLDLFEVQPEFLPLAQQLLPFYRKQMAELFPKEAQRELAWRVLKLLLLAHLAPDRDGLSVDEAAAWLLFAATRLDPARNRAIVERVLTTLAEEGRYVRLADGRFRLDLTDDSALALERLLKREATELRERGPLVFEALVPLLEGDGANPFELPREQWQVRKHTWHFHERPFAVYLGNDAPPPAPEPIALCIRLPWGSGGPAAGTRTLVPGRITLSDDLVELAALARLRERPLGEEGKRRLEGRLRERLALFRAQVRQCYLEARPFSPEGTPESPLRADPRAGLANWLGAYADWLLRRTYPVFERHAPSQGPLPSESYRRLMRHAEERDLGEHEADDFVKVVREGYLVPLGLLRRRGRDYVVAPQLDRHELVKQVLPHLEQRAAPRTLYQQLAAPPFGLVPDQVGVLLLFLLQNGILDIRKAGRSYREVYETAHNPIQYDELTPATSLDYEQTRALEQLCGGFGVRQPKQWSVLTQRQAVRHLREAGRAPMERLKALLVRLRRERDATALAVRLQALLDHWAALVQTDPELEALQRFLYAGPVGAFLQSYHELRELPERLERLLAEQQRFRHLLGQPALADWPDPALALRLEGLGEAPGLDHPEELERWLTQARGLYGEYQADYRARHDAYWAELARHPAWGWEPPPLAGSRHLALEQELSALRQAREQARRLRCHGLVDLDFQPRCACGYDGRAAPVAEPLERLAALRATIEETLHRFFGQESVRRRMREWWEQGLEMNPATRRYLDEGRGLPEVADLGLLDRHLAGVDLVKPVDTARLLAGLTDRTWEKAELLTAIDRELARYGNARLRVAAPAPAAASGLLEWCLEQALRQGVPLPPGLSAIDPDVLRPEWVGRKALQKLEALGLGEEPETRVLAWLLEGRLPAVGAERASPLVAAALELLEPTTPGDPAALAELAARLYRQHQRLRRLAPERWDERLETLARTPLDLPPLVERLAAATDRQWLVIDSLGLPLLPALLRALPELLPAWRLESTDFAAVAPLTTTDAFFGELAAHGINHPLAKADAVDHLLHGRFPPFAELERLAVAELHIALKPLAKRLDPARPLLLFADHGFRIDARGRAFVHGGASTLERVVPVVELGKG